MQKYEAILKTINNKIASSESAIEFYRDEVNRLERQNIALRTDLGKANEKVAVLSAQVEALEKANKELTAENHKLSKF